MPFVSVKCTSCGGEIQLDDQREIGFCVYCGNKVVFQEAIQKMELSGNVSVEGIATLEKLLQNAETFHRLGDFVKENKIFEQVTQDYPEDYRAWWGRALPYISKTPIPEKIYKDGSSKFCFARGAEEHDVYINLKNALFAPLKLIENAIMLAPPNEAKEMKCKAADFYNEQFSFLQHEKQKLNNPNKNYQKIHDAMERAGKSMEVSRLSQVNSRRTGRIIAELIVVVLALIPPIFFSLWWLLLTIPSWYMISTIIFPADDCEITPIHEYQWYIDKEIERSNIDREEFNFFANNARDKYGYAFWGSDGYSSSMAPEQQRNIDLKVITEMMDILTKWIDYFKK